MDDTVAQARALVNWLESQEINPQQAIVTMIYTIALISATKRDGGDTAAVRYYANELTSALVALR